MVAQFLAHKPVNFASLTDSFKIIETLILDANNSSSGPKTYRDFRETGPRYLISLSDC